MMKNIFKHIIQIITISILINACELFKNASKENHQIAQVSSINNSKDFLYFLSQEDIEQLTHVIPDSILSSLPFIENEKYTFESIRAILDINLQDTNMIDSIITLILKYSNRTTEKEVKSNNTQEFYKNLEHEKLVGKYPAICKFEKIDSVPIVITNLFPGVVFYYKVQPSLNIKTLSAFYDGKTYNPKTDFNILLLKSKTYNQFDAERKAYAIALIMHDLKIKVQELKLVPDKRSIKHWNTNYKINIKFYNNSKKTYYMRYKDEFILFCGEYPNKYIVPHLPSLTDYK